MAVPAPPGGSAGSRERFPSCERADEKQGTQVERTPRAVTGKVSRPNLRRRVGAADPWLRATLGGGSRRRMWPPEPGVAAGAGCPLVLSRAVGR